MAYDQNNIFARIIRGELPCKKVYEDYRVLAFEDLYPSAPVHVLVIPKAPYCSFDEFINLAPSDEVTHFFAKVRHITHLLDLQDTGYRIISNHGDDASQTVHHFHLHLLGKSPLGPLLASDVIAS